MMEERTQEELEWYMERFIGLIQQCLEEHESTRAYGDNWTVSTKKGPKYWKIITTATPKDKNAWLGTAPRHSVFGFVPSDSFDEVVADLSPSSALPIFESNFIISNLQNMNDSIFGIPAFSLTLPSRLPKKNVLSQITRSIYNKRKLKVEVAK